MNASYISNGSYPETKPRSRAFSMGSYLDRLKDLQPDGRCNILVMGPQNHGKSSFINSAFRITKAEGSMPFYRSVGEAAPSDSVPKTIRYRGYL